MTSIIQLISGVSKTVGAVKKDQRNQIQKFNFRGIDQVVNATHEAFTAHGIVAVPRVTEKDVREISSSGGKRQAWVMLTVEYTFYGPDGDSVVAEVASEATDMSDKATSKAMSVAYRTALLQVLHLPTDDPDPDSEYVERGGAPSAPSKPRQPQGAAEARKSEPEAQPDPTEFKRAHVTKLLKARKVPADHLKLFLAELGDYSGLSAVNNVEHLDSVRNWAEQAYPE